MAMRERLIKHMAEARGCLKPDSAASKTGIPCPFCRWDLSADEESGCEAHVDAILSELRNPSVGMIQAGAGRAEYLNTSPSDVDVEDFGSFLAKETFIAMIDEASTPTKPVSFTLFVEGEG